METAQPKIEKTRKHAPAVNELELGEKVGRRLWELLAADAARQLGNENLPFCWWLVVCEQGQRVSSNQTLHGLVIHSERLKRGCDRIRDVSEPIAAESSQLHLSAKIRRQVQLPLKASSAELQHYLAGNVVAWKLRAQSRSLDVSERINANMESACEPASECVLFVGKSIPREQQRRGACAVEVVCVCVCVCRGGERGMEHSPIAQAARQLPTTPPKSCQSDPLGRTAE